jgi:hypothetical protein
MSLQFHSAFEDLEIWSASSNGFSFVISRGSPTGLGLRGRAGYLASWRPLSGSGGAIKIAGSPFRTFTEAEEACNAMLGHLKQKDSDLET